MTPHWTELRAELRRWLAGARSLLIGCDFDGTLAPIALRPEDAQPSRGAQRIISRLASLPGVTVAIITGRALADIRRRFPVKGAWYAGNHGLEMAASEGPVLIAPGAEAARESLAGITKVVARRLAEIPGAWVEDKGFTASVHYRQADSAHHGRIADLVKHQVQGVAGLELRGGNCVWEIRPAVAWNKGSALRYFLDRAGVAPAAAAFFGDDVTDQDAFEAIPSGWSVGVGDASLLAKVRVNDCAEVMELLTWMLRIRSACLGVGVD